jgi:hypothetical protein
MFLKPPPAPPFSQSTRKRPAAAASFYEAISAFSVALGGVYPAFPFLGHRSHARRCQASIASFPSPSSASEKSCVPSCWRLTSVLVNIFSIGSLYVVGSGPTSLNDDDDDCRPPLISTCMHIPHGESDAHRVSIERNNITCLPPSEQPLQCLGFQYTHIIHCPSCSSKQNYAQSLVHPWFHPSRLG